MEGHPRAAAVALLAVLVAASTAAAAGAATGTATVAAAGAVGAQTDGGVSQTDAGHLRFELDGDAVGNGTTVTVEIAAAGRTESVTAGRIGTDGGTNEYRVPVDDLPSFPLSDATLNVTTGGETLLTDTGDFRYLRLDPESARFEGERLALNATARAGLGAEEFDLGATTDGGETVTLSALVDNGSVRVARTGTFARLLAPPGTITLTRADGGPVLGGDATVNLTRAATPSVVALGGRVVVDSPLLVPGTEYSVRITADGGQYVANRTAGTAADGIPRLNVTNEYLAGADELAVTVTAAGGRVAGPTRIESGSVAGSVTGSRTVSVDGRVAADRPSAALLTAGESVYVLDGDEVGFDGSAFTLTLPNGSALDADGSYRLAVAFDDGAPLVVSTGEGPPSPLVQANGNATGNTTTGGVTTRNTANGNESGLLSGVTSGPSGMVLMVAAVLVVFVLGYFGGGKAASMTAGGASETRTVGVEVLDERTGSPIRDTVRIRAERSGSSDRDRGGRRSADAEPETFTVSGESDEITLPRDPWTLTATYEGHRSEKQWADLGSDSVTLHIQPIPNEFRVVDERDEPVADAVVDVSYDGGEESARTDADGRASLTFPATASDLEATVSHDRFDGERVTAGDPSDLPATVGMAGRTGTLRVETAVDGESTDAVDVDVGTDDEWLRQRLSTVGAGVEGEGETNAAELPVGEYELAGTVDGGSFGEARRRVTVEEDATTTVTLDVPFEYDLTAAQRDELDALRRETEELVPGGRLDTAVHRFYASVAEELGDTVETVPDSGARFAETGVEPSTAVDGVLAAGRGAVDAVDDAMNTKHNVDLFSACADMRESSVRWTEGYDLDDLFALADADRVSQRAELRSRIADAEEEVEAHRGDVTVLSPAQDVLDELRTYARESRESDEVRNAAFVFSVAGFVSAVETLFDHPRLLDRLNRTVY